MYKNKKQNQPQSLQIHVNFVYLTINEVGVFVLCCVYHQVVSVKKYPVVVNGLYKSVENIT